MIMKFMAPAAILAIASSTALAADLPYRKEAPSMPVLVASAPYDWTGFYLGVQGGYGWGRSAETYTFANTAIANFN